MGWTIIGIGVLLIIIGLMIILGVSFTWPLLPGDVYITKGRMTFYFPIVSCIILSIVVSFILRFFR